VVISNITSNSYLFKVGIVEKKVDRERDVLVGCTLQVLQRPIYVSSKLFYSILVLVTSSTEM